MAVGALGTSYTLEDVMQQRRWQRCTLPFPHFVAHDVFTPEMYAELDSAYGDLLRRGLSDGQEPSRFSRNIKNYDVYSMTFNRDMPAPFHIFMSPAWHDMLASVAGIRATRDVNGGFHHHLRGSKSGQVHNDFNPGWFLDNSDPDAVNLSNSDLCNYSTGYQPGRVLPMHETVRALAVIYFLHNPAWSQGAGGETGLYASREQSVSSPTKAIPPINNSLFMFECTPRSLHSFIGNREGPRNTVIMWLHREKGEAVRRWGEESIVYWTDRPRNQPV